MKNVHHLICQILVAGFNPLDFLFNQGYSILLVGIGSLDAVYLLAAILISLLSGVLLVIVVNLVAFLVFLSLKFLNFLKQPFDRSKIIYHTILHIV